jgi:signal transduction histidine kinase
MDKKQYSTVWKNICLVIQMILTVIFVVSVFLLNALIAKNMLDTSDISNGHYQDSGCYSELFKQRTDNLLEFLKLRDKFEKDGKYDPDKVINVTDYAKNSTLHSKSTANNHVLVIAQDTAGKYSYVDGSSTGDASTDASSAQGDQAAEGASPAGNQTVAGAQAAEGGSTTSESQPAAGSGAKTDAKSDTGRSKDDLRVQKDKMRAAARLSNYVLSDLVIWSKNGYTTQNGVIQEQYLPIAGKSIADSLKDGEITRDQANSLYAALGQTLTNIAGEESTYKKGLNEFQTEDTNLTYTYTESGQVIYSNVDLTEDALAYARAKGSYMYYNDANLKFRTNVNGMDQYFYNTLDSVLSGLGNGAQLMVAVDTNFPQQDAFTTMKQEYSTLHPWILISIILLVISIFGWIITLVYLTMAAGHKENDSNITMVFGDRIKTEIFFALFVMMTVALIAISFAASESQWDVPGMLVMAGVSAFIYDVVFLIFYLSMVRRIKAEVLWEDSLTYWILRSTKRVLHTGKSALRVILIYILNILAFIFAAYLGFALKNVFAVLILLIMIVAEGVFYLRNVVQHQEIMKGIETITNGDLSYKLPLDTLHGDNCELAEAVNSIGDGLRNAVDESTKNERMKADLITNVSHDIKTPLTSIINYVNLLKIEPIEDKRIQEYIHILDDKSQRLKQLTEDLVEASRISSGNITLQMTKINLVELIYQTGGEFNEKFEAKDLTTITKLPKDAVVIMADGRRIWRVVENLYNNVAKYAMAHTRVYVTMDKLAHDVRFEIKNISEQPLNLETPDLTERFVRGDESRTTEGSGLGLSIARNLTTLMGGKFDIELDGDLFTATIIFPLVEE